MPTHLYDAHNHLAAAVFSTHLPEIESALEAIGLQGAVVNGTSPADWSQVIQLCRQNLKAIPAIGLHPWQVNDAPDDWQEAFESAFTEGGAQVVGEIGLDQWIEGHDIDRQQTAFRWQLAFAARRNLPVSIHCLKAIGPMMETLLRSTELPKRGIHIHAYNGPLELVDELLSMGAHFSFNSGQLKPNSKMTPEVIQAIPDDRILIETDAPDMLPPQELRQIEFYAPDSQAPLSHPSNLLPAYQAIAQIRQCSLEGLSEIVETNFKHYFLT